MICTVNLNLIHQIDQIVKFENSGSQIDFAEKLNISRGILNNYLNYMKGNFKLEIKYSHVKRSYYYETGSFYELKLGKS